MNIQHTKIFNGIHYIASIYYDTKERCIDHMWYIHRGVYIFCLWDDSGLTAKEIKDEPNVLATP